MFEDFEKLENSVANMNKEPTTRTRMRPRNKEEENTNESEFSAENINVPLRNTGRRLSITNLSTEIQRIPSREERRRKSNSMNDETRSNLQKSTENINLSTEIQRNPSREQRRKKSNSTINEPQSEAQKSLQNISETSDQESLDSFSVKSNFRSGAILSRDSSKKSVLTKKDEIHVENKRARDVSIFSANDLNIVSNDLKEKLKLKAEKEMADILEAKMVATERERKGEAMPGLAGHNPLLSSKPINPLVCKISN